MGNPDEAQMEQLVEPRLSLWDPTVVCTVGPALDPSAAIVGLRAYNVTHASVDSLCSSIILNFLFICKKKCLCSTLLCSAVKTSKRKD